MPDEKKFIVSLTEQVLAYDETFKEIFKGGGK